MRTEEKSIAIYIRVSTNDQAQDGYSLAAQEKILKAWASERHYRVADVYADAGISGKDMKHRPEVNRMMEDVMSGKIDVVAIWALSRLTRSVSDLYNMLSVMNRCGVDLYSHTESFDTSTPVGRAMVGILGVFAQMEREVTGERVKAAMAERASQGKSTCSYVLGYDRADDQLVINEKEADIVSFIFIAYAVCRNFTSVSKMCEKRGYKGKKGKVPKPENIKKVLTRPIYAGYYNFKNQLYKGDFQPIIPPSSFNKIQEMIFSKTKHKKKNIIFVPDSAMTSA